MKKLLLGALCTISATSSFAYDCTVLLIDEPTNRIITSFHGYRNGPADMCRDELRECNKSRHTQANPDRTRCEKLDSYYSGTGVYTPGGVVVVQPPVVVTPPVVVNPPPRPRGIFATDLILDMGNAVNTDSENKTKVINRAIEISGDSRLLTLKRICDPTSTWQDNLRCLVNGIPNQGAAVVSENLAESITTACTLANTWQAEKACYQAAVSQGRFLRIESFSRSCDSMYSSEDVSRCYRSLLGL